MADVVESPPSPAAAATTDAPPRAMTATGAVPAPGPPPLPPRNASVDIKPHSSTPELVSTQGPGAATSFNAPESQSAESRPVPVHHMYVFQTKLLRRRVCPHIDVGDDGRAQCRAQCGLWSFVFYASVSSVDPLSHLSGIGRLTIAARRSCRSAPTYSSPLRHHQRAPSHPRRRGGGSGVKETLNARSHYGSSDDGGGALHRINQYIIKQEIGRGSFGAVHLAVDQFGNEFVSLSLAPSGQCTVCATRRDCFEVVRSYWSQIGEGRTAQGQFVDYHLP